jgi:beta-glucosidase
MGSRWNVTSLMDSNPTPPAPIAQPTPPAYGPRFLWGAATSAHQVEGGNDRNDWWDWEAGEGRIRGGVRSGSASLHWDRYEEDLDLLKALGLNAYRFSIEWSRIEPEAGRYDDAALDHYRRVLEACRARAITPMVTLHHFTNPRWFAAMGGWESRVNLPYFERFARLAGERFGDLVDWWVTVNEPEVYGFYGYASGIWPPGFADRSRALQVIANLIEGHALAARALRETDRVDADGDGRATWVGAAKHWVFLEPRRGWWAADRLAAGVQHQVFNVAVAFGLAGGPIDLRLPGARPARRPADATRSAADYLGVNYYTRWMVTLTGKDPRSARRGAPVSDLGWEIYPEGLGRALRECSRFGLPLVVTESGIADQSDQWRPDFIRSTLRSLDEVCRGGLDVRGYFHWSLLDNFEWADGHHGRFGLFGVDLGSPEGPRIRRGSADVLAEEVSRRRRSA